MPVIVLDSVSQKPTSNSPETMKGFPPLPTEYDVASLKPSDPGASAGEEVAARAPALRTAGSIYRGPR
jgi:hypothetical protein